jgi:hypothetical protein
MMNTRPLRLSWWRKICYRFSHHADVERALRWMYSVGYKAGQRDALKASPWPYGVDSGPNTDPTLHPIPVPKTVKNLPPGTLIRTYSQTPGGDNTKRLKAINVAEMARLQALAKEKQL